MRAGRRPDRLGLEELAHAVDLDEVVDRQLGDDVAAVRGVADLALALEHLERLAHRHPRDAEALGERLLADRAPGASSPVTIMRRSSESTASCAVCGLERCGAHDALRRAAEGGTTAESPTSAAGSPPAARAARDRDDGGEAERGREANAPSSPLIGPHGTPAAVSAATSGRRRASASATSSATRSSVRWATRAGFVAKRVVGGQVGDAEHRARARGTGRRCRPRARAGGRPSA